MAICPLQALDPALDSAVDRAARAAPRCQAAFDQALAFARRAEFDPAHFRAVERNLQLATCRIT
jgi:hypothetical protein